jgi:hypothetical protein
MKPNSSSVTTLCMRAILTFHASLLLAEVASAQIPQSLPERPASRPEPRLPERSQTRDETSPRRDASSTISRQDVDSPRLEREPKPQQRAALEGAANKSRKAKELPAFKGKKQILERPSANSTLDASSTGGAKRELPQKANRRIEIDFENDGSSVPTTVIVRKPIGFNEALEQSTSDAEQIRVQSRTVIAAPPGDLSDLPTAKSAPTLEAPIEGAKATIGTQSIEIKTEASAQVSTDAESSPQSQDQLAKDKLTQNQVAQGKATLPDAPAPTRLSTEAALEEAELRSLHGNRLREALRRSWRLPPTEIESQKSESFEASAPELPPTAPSLASSAILSPESAEANAEVTVASSAAPSSRATGQIRAQTPVTGQRGQWELGDRRSVSLRVGALRAEWSKFDARMRNGATSFGLGMAQELMSPWGSLEARASFDLYHAIDQAVTIDNIRMLSTRTEVAYWLTHSRVRPALTLGMGVTEYAVRSYRAVGENGDVTIRTHSRGTAFTIIPGTALRVDLNQDFRFDLQTEYLLHLGGDQSSRSQGLQVIGALGWTL